MDVQRTLIELGIAAIALIALFGLAMFILMLVVWINIFKKTGFGAAMGCLMFVPVLNFIMLLILAFAEWPIERELKSLRRAGGRKDDGYRDYGDGEYQ